MTTKLKPSPPAPWSLGYKKRFALIDARATYGARAEVRSAEVAAMRAEGHFRWRETLESHPGGALKIDLWYTGSA